MFGSCGKGKNIFSQLIYTKWMWIKCKQKTTVISFIYISIIIGFDWFDCSAAYLL